MDGVRHRLKFNDLTAMGPIKRLLLTAVAVCSCLPAFGQSITLLADTDLRERPESTSTVKMTLPAGLELSVLSEQGDWLAVSTSTGIVGWISRPGGEPAEPESTDQLDDLLRSIDEANQEPPPTPAPAPPSPDVEPPSPPSDTPSAAPPTPAPTPNVSAPPSPSVTPSSVTPPPPPPPSARPPSGDSDISFGNTPAPDAPFTNVAAGFYDKYQWITAALDLKEDFKRLDLQFNKLLGNITQLGAWLSGTDGFIIPSFDEENLRDFGDLTLKGETTESCPCDGDVKSVQGGLRFNVYPVYPTADRPFGMYLGGFLGGGAFSGDDAPESVSMATGGAEIGLYSKFGSPNSPQFIPSAQIQFARTEFICGSDATFCGFDPETFESKDHVGDSATTVRFGVEMNYHGLVPGVHVTLLESPDPDKTFETLFGFGFTLAY
jgi:hypothetical protein